MLTSGSVLFAAHIFVALHSMLFAPTKKGDVEEQETYTESKGKEPMVEDEQQWEMVRIPETPGTVNGMTDFPLSPTTPRTRAFNTLGGDRGRLPSRDQHFPPPPTKAT